MTNYKFLCALALSGIGTAAFADGGITGSVQHPVLFCSGQTAPDSPQGGADRFEITLSTDRNPLCVASKDPSQQHSDCPGTLNFRGEKQQPGGAWLIDRLYTVRDLTFSVDGPAQTAKIKLVFPFEDEDDVGELTTTVGSNTAHLKVTEGATTADLDLSCQPQQVAP